MKRKPEVFCYPGWSGRNFTRDYFIDWRLEVEVVRMRMTPEE